MFNKVKKVINNITKDEGRLMVDNEVLYKEILWLKDKIASMKGEIDGLQAKCDAYRKSMAEVNLRDFEEFQKKDY